MTEYEKMGGTYRQAGDYILPNLTVGTQATIYIGVWGERHRRYLKEHHKVRYYNLLTAGMLDNYLADIEIQAEKLFDQTVKHSQKKRMLRKN